MNVKSRRWMTVSRWLALSSTLFSLSYSQATLTRADNAEADYKVKPAFIYNILKFTEWPESVLTPGSTTITICSLGKAPLNQALGSLNGRPMGARTLSLISVDITDDLDRCHMLVHGGYQVETLSNLYKKIANKPIVSVGEAAYFARDYGIIGLSVEKERVLLEIHNDRAKKIGIRFSSKLLEVAAKVYSDADTP